MERIMVPVNISTELTKLMVILVVIISAVVLLVVEKVAPEAGVGLITASLGYVFGNGHGIMTAQRALDSKVENLARAGTIDRREH
jgi:uncharacterized protein (DUF2164 family)